MDEAVAHVEFFGTTNVTTDAWNALRKDMDTINESIVNQPPIDDALNKTVYKLRKDIKPYSKRSQ